MSNENETVVVNEEETPTTAQEVIETEETTPEVEETPSTETETLPRNITRDEDGQLVLKRGTSVYKGKDLDELLDNVSKGIEEKDNYVLQLKTDKAIKSEKPLKEETDNVKYPDPQEIRTTVFGDFNRKYGRSLPAELKPEMANWDVQQWRSFADEKEIRSDEISDLKAIVHSANEQASKTITKVDTEYINDLTRRQASKNIRELLTEFKLNPDDYSKAYSEALRAVDSDSNQKDGGIYLSGRIELSVAKAIIKDLTEMGVKSREAEVLTKVKEGQKVKEKIRGASVSGAQNKQTVKVPESLKEIKEQLRKEGRL